eukprot:RCo014747
MLSASEYCGFMSVIFWTIAQVPQIVKNHQSKSVDDISVQFLLLWLVGDSANLLGCYLGDGLLTQILLGVYFVMCDVTLLGQWSLYSHEARKTRHASWTLGASAVTMAALFLIHRGTGISYSQLLGWLSSGIYLLSRVPQLVHNFTHKHTEDLSPLLFGFAVGGNTTYALSIVSHSVDPTYLTQQLPWLLGSAGTLFFDAILLYQIRLYRICGGGCSVNLGGLDCAEYKEYKALEKGSSMA